MQPAVAPTLSCPDAGGRRSRGALRRSLPGIAAALVVSLALGCGDREAAPPRPTSLRTADLRLIAPGAAPQEPLRYALTIGTRQRITLALHLTMRVAAAQSPIPPVTAPGLRLTVELTVVEATPGGGGRCQLEIADADLADIDVAPPALVAEMRKGLPGVIGARGELTIEPDGTVRQVALDTAATLGDELGQFVAAARLALEELAVRLPDDAVGVGASWDVARTIEQSGIAVRQKTLFELTARDGARAKLRFQVSQVSERQQATLRGLPPGVTADIVAYEASGSGEIELDLGRPAPVRARADVTTGVDFRLVQSDKRQAMSLSSESKLEIDAL